MTLSRGTYIISIGLAISMFAFAILVSFLKKPHKKKKTSTSSSLEPTVEAIAIPQHELPANTQGDLENQSTITTGPHTIRVVFDGTQAAGIHIAQCHNNGSYMVTRVDDNSPAGHSPITKGMTIASVNGILTTHRDQGFVEQLIRCGGGCASPSSSTTTSSSSSQGEIVLLLTTTNTLSLGNEVSDVEIWC